MKNVSLYNGDPSLPVLSYTKTSYDSAQITKLMLRHWDRQQLCCQQPINVSTNVAFLVDLSMLDHPEDVKSDEMGVWHRTGSPKRFCFVNRNDEGKVTSVQVHKKEPQEVADQVYILRRLYYQHKYAKDLHKNIAFLAGEKNVRVLTYKPSIGYILSRHSNSTVFFCLPGFQVQYLNFEKYPQRCHLDSGYLTIYLRYLTI